MKKLSFLIVFVVLLGFTCYCQPGNPTKPVPVPISGIEILIGIGSLFGASRFFKGKNKSKKEL